MTTLPNPRTNFTLRLAGDDGPGCAEFTFRPLTLRETNEIASSLAEVHHLADGTTIAKNCVPQARLMTLRATLIGWKNLHDETGAEIAFATEKEPVRLLGSLVHPVKAELLDRFPLAWVEDLAERVYAMAKTTPADRKN